MLITVVLFGSYNDWGGVILSPLVIKLQVVLLRQNQGMERMVDEFETLVELSLMMAGEKRICGKSIPLCCFAHLKFYINCPGIQPATIQPPELWHTLLWDIEFCEIHHNFIMVLAKDFKLIQFYCLICKIKEF